MAGLSDDHRQQLEKESAIARDVIEGRGYFSATSAREAEGLGFARSQARPGLVLPIFSPATGKLAGYQLKPDKPRMGKDGKIVKYETKRGARAFPDIHPSMFAKLQNAAEPLIVTEGIKKGDAAASKGLCALALTGGVWGLQTKGGIHDELRCIPLRDRPVLVVFDSDVTTNANVKRAAERAREILQALGAKVRFIVLQPGPNGEKTGLDDFFVRGGIVEELLSSPVDDLPFVEGEDSAGLHPPDDLSQLDKLLFMIIHDPSIELFRDPDDEETGYATIGLGTNADERLRTYNIDSRGFRSYLTKRFYKMFASALSGEALNAACNTLRARALDTGLKRETRVRVGGTRTTRWLLDLANEAGTVIEITADGRRTVDAGQPRFVRPYGLLPLPKPSEDSGCSLDEDLFIFTNIRDDAQMMLVIAVLVQSLCPSGPYPILCLSGEHGSAKSFTHQILRSLIDPNLSPLRTQPKDEHALMISARSSRILCFNNVSQISEAMSDAYCTIATGGGLAVRELYTTAEEHIFVACQPVWINGIPTFTNRPDFVDRSVLIELPPIAEELRITEEELTDGWREAHARALRALLDLAVKVLAELPKVDVDNLPRMADFARIGIAVERALGWLEGSFLEAYRANAAKLRGLALESGFGSVLLQVINKGMQFNPSGTFQWELTGLLRELHALADQNFALRRYLPHTERGLRAQLERIAPVLRQEGIDIEFGKDGTSRRAAVRFTRRSTGENAATE